MKNKINDKSMMFLIIYTLVSPFAYIYHFIHTTCVALYECWEDFTYDVYFDILFMIDEWKKL